MQFSCESQGTCSERATATAEYIICYPRYYGSGASDMSTHARCKFLAGLDYAVQCTVLVQGHQRQSADSRHVAYVQSGNKCFHLGFEVGALVLDSSTSGCLFC